jgi:hypothetical protein
MENFTILLQTTRDGFARIDQQLDAINRHLRDLNGSVSRHERELGEVRVKVDVLNHETFDRPKRPVETRTDRRR